MAEVEVHPLDADRPGWGRVFVVPWDTDIFGFPVGTYAPGDAGVIRTDLEDFLGRFRAWTTTHRVELVSCTVPADDRAWRALMPPLGFTCVEQTLDLTFRVQA